MHAVVPWDDARDDESSQMGLSEIVEEHKRLIAEVVSFHLATQVARMNHAGVPPIHLPQAHMYQDYEQPYEAEQDPRAFYSYVPNETKHRRRTTRAQLKVLEEVFLTDTKPNAVLRKDLATRLGMNTRGVQVWFQNRRAKEKTLAKKLAAAREKQAQQDSPEPAEPEEEAPKVEYWDELRNPEDRRGSLPAYSPSFHGAPAVEAFDVMYNRRRSIDAMNRLSSHPYAPLARAKNGVARISTPPQFQPRLSLPQRSSMPPDYHVRHSMDASQRYGPFTMSTRTVSSPLPGPLPAPNFSFGAPSSSSPSDETYDYPRNDLETDDSTSSYDAYSRFGSLASINSDTSFYSDIGSCGDGFDPSSRRSSYASGPFLGLMDNLNVSDREHLAVQTQLSTYPSPTSTVSPGGSPGSVPTPHTSQLANVLKDHAQIHHSRSSSAEADYTFAGGAASTTPNGTTFHSVIPNASAGEMFDHGMINYHHHPDDVGYHYA